MSRADPIPRLTQYMIRYLCQLHLDTQVEITYPPATQKNFLSSLFTYITVLITLCFERA
jgi:hypothetical protein